MSLRTAAWVFLAISGVTACSDGTAPSPASQPRLPSFSYSANGTALNQANGTLRENGTCPVISPCIVKGFNPTNPHHGDAIVATFYWVGSTNIIDSVDDVLTDAQYTRVGNKYNLVDYVTAGGYSMATYLATNVQNFPDPNDPSNGVVLAVRALLSQYPTDGGVTISSWTGVYDTFAGALADHAFASGSDTTVTTAHTRPITADSGAMVYTVTMGGLTGLD
ncbi:MAG TPA: hypothetical protein VGU74_13130, partial [Gemmatimonadales bacterium]|nr:hypothetical protein [Gemmatimonadales bacterium]